MRKPAGQRERLGRRKPPDAINAGQPNAGAAHSLLGCVQYGTLSLIVGRFFALRGEKTTQMELNIVHCSSFVVHRSSFIVRRSSFVTCSQTALAETARSAGSLCR